ncbi:MAG: 2-oxoacid:acceptor oxidoreductase family protein [Deltaproteobacteria bacterium]|nr:2-oxoacid:acceptor oxidoreductase family protein [Candidatus Anaeroferrophillacea bacterium]
MLEQIRLCGFGGQGVVLAGTLLGHAATSAGFRVAGANAYGAQARGGAAIAEVVIANAEIVFPHVITADLLVCYSQTGYDRFAAEVGGTHPRIFYDSLLVKPAPAGETVAQFGIPATDEALRQLGGKQAANIILLAAAVARTALIGRLHLATAIAEHGGARFRETNLKALDIGFRLGAAAAPEPGPA